MTEPVTNISASQFLTRIAIRAAYVAVGTILLLVLSAWVVETRNSGLANVESFRFISLLILFMTALAITAAVYAGLQLGDRGEAFGLPSGSVRALLAIGILILFVVFGLPVITPDRAQETPRAAIAEVPVPQDKLGEAVNTYIQQKFGVVITDYGAAPDASATDAAIKAGRLARIKVFEADHSSERFDEAKQIIAAILTLLTSVVSFYFGSRSVTDSLKSDPKSDATATELSVRRKELGAKLETVKAQVADAAGKLEQIKTLPDPADETKKADRDKAAAAVETRRAAIQDKLDLAARNLKVADDALTMVQGASATDARAAGAESARNALGALGDGLVEIEGLIPALTAEIENYRKASTGE